MVAGALPAQRREGRPESTSGRRRASARLLRRGRPAGLAPGGARGGAHAAKAALPPDLRALGAGHSTVDVENATADAVRAAAAQIDDAPPRDKDEPLARAKEGLARSRPRAGGGRVAGTLLALSEQRVETLLLDQGLGAPGAVCPRCGRLAGAAVYDVPRGRHADQAREDVAPEAVERATPRTRERPPARAPRARPPRPRRRPPALLGRERSRMSSRTPPPGLGPRPIGPPIGPNPVPARWPGSRPGPAPPTDPEPPAGPAPPPGAADDEPGRGAAGGAQTTRSRRGLARRRGRPSRPAGRRRGRCRR